MQDLRSFFKAKGSVGDKEKRKADQADETEDNTCKKIKPAAIDPMRFFGKAKIKQQANTLVKKIVRPKLDANDREFDIEELDLAAIEAMEANHQDFGEIPIKSASKKVAEVLQKSPITLKLTELKENVSLKPIILSPDKLDANSTEIVIDLIENGLKSKNGCGLQIEVEHDVILRDIANPLMKVKHQEISLDHTNPIESKEMCDLVKSDLIMADIASTHQTNLASQTFNIAIQSSSHPKLEGAENCLCGLSFVVTGNFLSLSRTDLCDAIRRYGGYTIFSFSRIVTAPSSKTSYILVGADPGASKMEKVHELKLKTLNEQEFYEFVNSANSQEISKPVLPKPISTSKAAVQKSHQDENDEIKPSQLWTDKYKPTSYAQVIGNTSTIDKLKKWLKNWDLNRKNGFAKVGGDESASFRACLISGRPGLGKTTAAHLVAKLEGFQAMEFNASDVRSKKALEDMMKEATQCKTITELFAAKTNGVGSSSKSTVAKSFLSGKVIIMDEVDGTSGGDRGGIGELVTIIKQSRVPIICICNDRRLPKIKTLATYCLDLSFRKPTAIQVEKRIQNICEIERLTLKPNVIVELVASTGGDIRQILNLLSTFRLGADTMKYDDAKKLSTTSSKNVTMNIFDITAQLFDRQNFRSISFSNKCDLYFQDFQMIPLMVQENYIRMKPAFAMDSGLSGNAGVVNHLSLLAKAADSISFGNILETLQQRESSWSLLPAHAVISTVTPCFYTHGHMSGFPNFAGWLGQNSKQIKGVRILRELHDHASVFTSGDKNEFRLNYLPTIAARLTKPLEGEDPDISGVIKFMDEYWLTRDDWDSVLDLGYQDYLKNIPTKNKSSFTRNYNKMAHANPFIDRGVTKSVGTSKMRDDAPDLEDVIDVDSEGEKSDAEANISKKQIKKEMASVRKPKPTKTKAAPKSKSKE